jgi:hypothetical protein
MRILRSTLTGLGGLSITSGTPKTLLKKILIQEGESRQREKGGGPEQHDPILKVKILALPE